MNQPHTMRSSQGSARLGRTASIAMVSMVALLLLWTAPWKRFDDQVRTLTIYSCSALQEVMEESILPGFQRSWLERTGQRVAFIPVFAGSASIVERILDRVPAQVVLLASEMDGYRLVHRGMLLASVWHALPQGGVISESPMVLVTRPGNPKGVRGFEDLVRGDVQVVLADPDTSGLGEWSILAVYGEALRRSGGPSGAAAALESLRARVVSTPSSARAAGLAFVGGQGDVLLTYEHEAHRLQGEGREIEVVRPPVTIMTRHIVVRITRNAVPEDADLVAAFVDFLFSREAQVALAAHGLRSPGGQPAAGSLSLEELGGAERAYREIIGRQWQGLKAAG